MGPQFALDTMMGRQPEEIRRLAGIARPGHAETLARADRVFIVGTGTSQHAAELGALMLAEAGVDARAISSSAFVRASDGIRPGDAAIVISHTGETAFARRARNRLLAGEVPAVLITGSGRGWPDAIETVAAEQSDTYTVSYLACLTVLARLAFELGAGQFAPADLDRAAMAVQAVLDSPIAPPIHLPERALAIVGAGPWGITAREGALKLREASRTLAEGFDAEFFLHGAAVPFTPSDALILLEPADDPDGLTAALGAAAAAEGIRVDTLSLGHHGLHPLLAQWPLTVRLQQLAAQFARERGQNPDVAIVGAWADPALWQLGAGDSG